jgi:SAM-dependent methyltransferase
VIARNPQAEIEAGNPWYTEDQFATQLGSPVFRAVVEHRWSIFVRAMDEWRATTGRSSPAAVLDAGCGDGVNFAFLARLRDERCWSTQLVGADYNPIRIQRARTQPRSSVVRTSVTAFGFRDRSFDIVICNQVLEHVPDDRSAFRELRRILRPGGLLIAGVPNEGSPLGILRNHVLQRSILKTTDHVNMYTRARLGARIVDAGLQLLRVETEGFFTPHTTLHALLNSSAAVRGALNGFARLMPSCAAGLQAVAVRPQ